MKNLILFFAFFVAIHGKANAQIVFAPNGAEWYYSHYSFSSSLITYNKIKSIKDTIVAGTLCKELLVTGQFHGCTQNDYEFVYNDSEKVYRYDIIDHTFKLIYDFSLGVGDSYYSHGFIDVMTDSFLVNIDSVGTIVINGHTLKLMHLSSTNWDFTGNAIEYVGNLYFLFPQWGLCDNEIYTLRCYSDSNIGYYNTGITSSCDTVFSGIEESIDLTEPSVYPNPSQFYLNIVSDDFMKNEILSVRFYNMMGAKNQNISFEKQNFNRIRINVSSLASGLYLLEVRYDNGQSKKIKFQKF